MNITKEQMLERIREWKGAFDTHPDKMDEWSLCFMEDYKVYDAIRSLIESSGDKAVPASDRLTVPCENDPMPAEVDVEYWRKITSEADKRNTAPVQKGTHLSTSVEVEEAMRWFNDVLSLLESINIRIDETDAPHVAVIRAALSKPPVSVTREWIRKCVRGWMDCSCPTSIEDLVIDIIREKGIEVEEKP